MFPSVEPLIGSRLSMASDQEPSSAMTDICNDSAVLRKKELREHYRNQRHKQPHRITALDRLVLDEVGQWALHASSEAWLGLYWPLPGEIDLRFLRNHYNIALPCSSQDGSMVFRPWGQSALQPDGCGIPAPCGDGALSASDLFLMLVPALAMDRHGIRLGYGGGFYDRLRAQTEWRAVPALVVIEAAFLKETALPRDAWDVAFDGWITEQGAGRPGIPAAS